MLNHAGMTLVNMSITLGLIPFAAHLADKGLPRLAATAVVLAIAAVASVPMLLAVSSRHMVAAWLMQVGVGKQICSGTLVVQTYVGGWHADCMQCYMIVHRGGPNWRQDHTVQHKRDASGH